MRSRGAPAPEPPSRTGTASRSGWCSGRGWPLKSQGRPAARRSGCGEVPQNPRRPLARPRPRRWPGECEVSLLADVVARAPAASRASRHRQKLEKRPGRGGTCSAAPAITGRALHVRHARGCFSSFRRSRGGAPGIATRGVACSAPGARPAALLAQRRDRDPGVACSAPGIATRGDREAVVPDAIDGPATGTSTVGWGPQCRGY
jgi:hypothetical protein